MNSTIRAVLPVLAALAFAPLHAAAQSYALDRGSHLIGGTAGLVSSGSEVDGQDSDDRVITFSLLPKMQYFFAPGFAFGGELVLTYSSDGDDSVLSYGLGPAATYYFGSGERSSYPYVGASLQFVWENPDSDGNPDLETAMRTGYRGAAGMLFMLSSGVGMNAELFYEKTDREIGDFELSNNAYGLAVGITAFVF